MLLRRVMRKCNAAAAAPGGADGNSARRSLRYEKKY
jgi:hypothetical protein